jgi:hypothetical protein
LRIRKSLTFKENDELVKFFRSLALSAIRIKNARGAWCPVMGPNTHEIFVRQQARQFYWRRQRKRSHNSEKKSG